MSNRQIFNVQYNIPRANISFPGRQNRSSNSVLHITPGVTEPFEFWFGNQDGVPINLLPFKIKWIFWQNETLDLDYQAWGHSKVLLAKTIDVEDPYSGKVVAILEADETQQLARDGLGTLRWSLFMLTEQGQVFPAQVNSQGQRYGTAYLDLESGIPIAEVVKSA